MRVHHKFTYTIRAKLKTELEHGQGKNFKKTCSNINYATTQAKWLIEQKYTDKVIMTITGKPA